MGKNDRESLGDGWYGAERSPEGILFRATGPVAGIRLVGNFDRAEISIFAAARPEHAGEDLVVELRQKQSVLARMEWSLNQWLIRRAGIEFDPGDELTIYIVNPWSPDALYENGDARQLGLMVSAIRAAPNFS